MSFARNTFKYHVKVGLRTVDRGITYDLNRREAEMQKEFPGSRLQQIGRRTMREEALRWERRGGRRRYRRVPSGVPWWRRFFARLRG